MKKYKKFVIISIIGIVLFTVVSYGWLYYRKAKIEKSPRANSECLTEDRVFDFANVLSKEEEKKLEKLIKKSEEIISGDIVIVTSLDNVYTMEAFADDFYDEYKFGWDQPWGDGVLLADNCNTEECWMSTSGSFIDLYYDEADIDGILDKTCEFIDISPYYAYKTFINRLVEDKVSLRLISSYFTISDYIVVSIFLTSIFILFNILRKYKSIETNKTTYSKGGTANILNVTDSFISKNTTVRVVNNNSSGKGGSRGGSHRSRSGRSHGGGGRRH